MAISFTELTQGNKQDPRALPILAKTIYRELRANGYEENDVMRLGQRASRHHHFGNQDTLESLSDSTLSRAISPAPRGPASWRFAFKPLRMGGGPKRRRGRNLELASDNGEKTAFGPRKRFHNPANTLVQC